MATSQWLVYMIQANDGSLYTGITTDMARRWQQHCDGKGGARFFRGRRPKQLVYLEEAEDRSTASKREAAIKKLARPAKLALLGSGENQLPGWPEDPLVQAQK